MSFPRYGLFNSIQELKDKCPSRKHGRTWRQELNYRNDCVQMMEKCCESLKLHPRTLHKAIVLLQRFFSRCSSTEWTAMKKWAIASACVFLATKIDSSYHRLDSVTHACYRALRAHQGREPEPEYYNADGTPGNPRFVAGLAAMVRDAEMDLIFALNFDFNATEVASSIVVYQMNELGLQDAPHALRNLAWLFAVNSITAPRSVVCLLYGSREIALGCISKACRAHGWPLDVSSAAASAFVPVVSQERLAAIENALPKIVGDSSAADSAATSGGKGAMDGSSIGAQQGLQLQQQQQQQHGHTATGLADGCGTPGSSFRDHGNGAAAAGAAGLKQVHCAGGVSHGSASEAATAGPRMGPSPISPDSETGPSSGAYGAAAGSSGRPEQQQQQCRKRAREEGCSSGPLVVSEPPARKTGGMLAV